MLLFSPDLVSHLSRAETKSLTAPDKEESQAQQDLVFAKILLLKYRIACHLSTLEKGSMSSDLTCRVYIRFEPSRVIHNNYNRLQ